MDFINLKVLASSELRKIATECYDILEERKREKKEELIEAFKVACFNLKDAGIEVRYECDCCGEEISLDLVSLDFGNLYFK